MNRVFMIQRNVMSGQCKAAPLRIQVRFTAVILFPCLIPGWSGSQIGLFAPRKVPGGYRCTGFYFHPWLAPDIAVMQLPSWYRRLMRAFHFETKDLA